MVLFLERMTTTRLKMISLQCYMFYNVNYLLMQLLTEVGQSVVQ